MVVVGVHWGTENSHVVNDAQRTLAQKIADWGADIIIGTHPHVVQTIEMLTSAKDGTQVPVAYSLGNFVSTQIQEMCIRDRCKTLGKTRGCKGS